MRKKTVRAANGLEFRQSAKKRHFLGQHFLRDTRVIDAIVEEGLAQIRAHSAVSVLEIGPGGGALTEVLEKKLPESGNPEWRVCEADREIIAFWRERAAKGFGKSSKFRVISGDFLQAPETVWLWKSPLVVISNLPYSAGTPITLRLLEKRDRIPGLVLMYQAEVARRFRAEPGSKDWGSLSLWTQNFWDVRKLLAVPPGAFSPPPKVDSEVVVFTPRKSPRIAMTPEQEPLWEKLLKAAFAHRRKMLRAGLPKNGPWLPALEASGIDPTLRAETLDWAQWESLWKALLERSTERPPREGD